MIEFKTPILNVWIACDLPDCSVPWFLRLHLRGASFSNIVSFSFIFFCTGGKIAKQNSHTLQSRGPQSTLKGSLRSFEVSEYVASSSNSSENWREVSQCRALIESFAAPAVHMFQGEINI